MGKVHKDQDTRAKRERVPERARSDGSTRPAQGRTVPERSAFARTASSGTTPERPAWTKPAARPTPSKPASHTKKQRSGKGAFILLGVAFAATIVTGLREGTAAQLGQTTRKAAVLSAQLTYPQGGQSVAAREMQKLQTLFSGTTRRQPAASSAGKAAGKSAASGK